MRAIFDIAFHSEGRATQIKEIADRQSIPPRFLEQIFQELKRAGLVTARRGPRGGYQLARAAAEIRIGDIVRALEGPITVSRATDDTDESGDAASRNIIDAAFVEIGKNVEACFDAVTIETLCERGDALGQRRRPSSHVYVI